MDFERERRDAEDQVGEACAELGVPELAERIDVEFNGRFTARLGDADPVRWRVRLSRPLWPRASRAERRAVVRHETCHLVARHLHGRGIRPHGPEWSALMRRLGERAERCHRVDRTGIARRARRVTAWCDCRTHSISVTRAGRIRNGTTLYGCRTCKSLLRLEP